MPTEFEWKIFLGITALSLLEKIQNLMRDLKCELEHFKDRIIFMSKYNDIEWKAKGNKERCEYNSQTVANYARKFPRGHWSFLEPRSEQKWYGIYTDKPDGSWDRIAENMMSNFSDSGHPIFRELRSKGRGKKSIHFNGSNETIELLLRTVISANQLSVYGAVADLWNELSEGLRATVKPEAPDHLETMEIPTGIFNAETPTNAQQRWNLVQEYERKFEHLSGDHKLSKTVLWCGSEACRTRTIPLYSSNRRRTTVATSMLRIHDAPKWKGDPCERMDSQEYKNPSSLEHKSLLSSWSIQCRSSSSISVSRRYRFLSQNRDWRW